MKKIITFHVFLIILISNFIIKKSFAQNEVNYIRIKTNGFNGRITDLKIIQDSLLKWVFYPTENDTVYIGIQYLYNNEFELIKIIRYENNKIKEVHNLPLDNSGKPIRFVERGEFDNCQGSECVWDKYNRLIEVKSYRKTKRKKILETWNKYIYFYGLDYKLLCESFTF